MEVDFKKVITHHWLLRPKEKTFHAYAPVRVGAVPVCGSGEAIVSLKEMNIPSDRSACCINCFDNLYGLGMAVNSGGAGL